MYTLDNTAIDSLRTTMAESTTVWVCHACGHTMTEPLKQVDDYYDKHYNILTGSEDEDQLLKIIDGKKIYRSDFQADNLVKAVALKSGMRVLDYGCAKAATMKKLLARVAIEPFVFDVSENYRTFWEEAIAADHQATYAIPSEWHGTMDVVYSFFCLEHVADPVAALSTQRQLLRNGGTCYFVVPNFLTNVADVLVLDHINHFASTSLDYCLRRAGFINITLDSTTQSGGGS